MKDNGTSDAGANGNHPARSPVGKNAEGEYRQNSQQRDFEKDRNHRHRR
jgi:hypothetical protein